MKNYFRLLRYVKSYKGYALLNILFNMLSVIFSLVSLTMVIPFLNVLFSQATEFHQEPWSLSPKALFANFNYYLSQYISANGKMEALHSDLYPCNRVVFSQEFLPLSRHVFYCTDP
ncbi:MAG: hypothetical protein IPQ03_08835 [Bacteroidetes bacterium]|nr:hypothetical protein [Bacteroidota bacterium]